MFGTDCLLCLCIAFESNTPPLTAFPSLDSTASRAPSTPTLCVCATLRSAATAPRRSAVAAVTTTTRRRAGSAAVAVVVPVAVLVVVRVRALVVTPPPPLRPLVMPVPRRPPRSLRRPLDLFQFFPLYNKNKAGEHLFKKIPGSGFALVWVTFAGRQQVLRQRA